MLCAASSRRRWLLRQMQCQRRARTIVGRTLGQCEGPLHIWPPTLRPASTARCCLPDRHVLRGAPLGLTQPAGQRRSATWNRPPRQLSVRSLLLRAWRGSNLRLSPERHEGRQQSSDRLSQQRRPHGGNARCSAPGFIALRRVNLLRNLCRLVENAHRACRYRDCLCLMKPIRRYVACVACPRQGRHRHGPFPDRKRRDLQ